MKPQKSWFVVAGVVFLIALVLVWTNMMSVQHKNAAESTIINAVGDELDDINLKIPGADRNSFWDLNVVKLTKVRNNSQLVGIDGQYIQNKKALYTIQAKEGKFNWQTRNFELKGSVHFQTSDGKELSAEQIRWEPAKNRLIAVGQVSLRNQQLQLTTNSIDTDLELDRAKLSGDTKVKYREGINR